MHQWNMKKSFAFPFWWRHSSEPTTKWRSVELWNHSFQSTFWLFHIRCLWLVLFVQGHCKTHLPEVAYNSYIIHMDAHIIYKALGFSHLSILASDWKRPGPEPASFFVILPPVQPHLSDPVPAPLAPLWSQIIVVLTRRRRSQRPGLQVKAQTNVSLLRMWALEWNLKIDQFIYIVLLQEELTSLTVFVQTFCLLGVKLWQDIKKKRQLITVLLLHLHAPEIWTHNLYKWTLNHISPTKNSPQKKNVRPFWPENSFLHHLPTSVGGPFKAPHV